MQSRKMGLSGGIVRSIVCLAMAMAVCLFMGTGEAQSAKGNDHFKLVKKGQKAVIQVEGTYREWSEAEDAYVRYDAEGTFSVTLAPVPASDSYASGYNFNASWENWSPRVTGVVVLHKPEGDVTFNYNFDGMADYREYRYTNGRVYQNFEVETYARSTGSGPDFTWLELRLSSREEGTEGFATTGDASISSWWAGSGDNDLYLRGTYTLEDSLGQAGSDIRKGAKPATQFVRQRGQTETYTMVDRGMNLEMDMDGYYQYRDPETGQYIRLDAYATLRTNVVPVPSDDGYYRSWYYPYWDRTYENYNVWIPQKTIFKGTVTIMLPDGETEEFNIVFFSNVSSGYTARRIVGEDWDVTAYFDYANPTKESGNTDINFIDGSGSLRSYDQPDPKLGPEGDARFSLYGYNGMRLYLSGPYASNN